MKGFIIISHKKSGKKSSRFFITKTPKKLRFLKRFYRFTKIIDLHSFNILLQDA